ncbi:unnamed protein product [Nezara viridula]|uniref:Uncharacterized protein n=1 Tax=Nezara viridula TaxID=85310 RepID=A0A9P0HQR2_NEZVI|nr:unnamed protein product [Nezara viridula]
MRNRKLPLPSDPLPDKCKSLKKTYGKKIEKETEPSSDLSEISEDCFTDILSSDSDDSSIEEIKNGLMSLKATSRVIGESVEEEESPEDEESLERMIFYSMYLDDDFNTKEEPDIEPQRSYGYDNYRPYTGIEAYLKDQEAQQYIWGEMENEQFENVLNAGLKEELGLEDIDGNVSIKTLADNNFQVLGMDGPTRKIALIFDYRPEDGIHISSDFRYFMNSQKEKFTNIGGVLLLYEEIGIHIIEGSEYVLLRHFPIFFKDQIFIKLLNCKVLGVEELSAMKSFKHYACYKGFPRKLKQKIPEKIFTYVDSIKFLQQLGKRLNTFLKFVYSDKPSKLVWRICD